MKKELAVSLLRGSGTPSDDVMFPAYETSLPSRAGIILWRLKSICMSTDLKLQLYLGIHETTFFTLFLKNDSTCFKP